MPQINRSALVRFSAQQMYDLVNDVASYPQFLPGCVGGEVHSHEAEQMVATVAVKKAGIAQSFTTINSLTLNEKVSMKLKEGPFSSLQGDWSFKALTDSACKVELSLSFEFANPVAQKAFGKIFNDLAQNMVMAFSERAKEVYRG
ncbi:MULTISPECIES: type II toxin-antitoxin system RatA family toxin [Ferrimonas]|uniref:type II toxin-antitoxin system RatA family toxin n=1 Tax=Ferrimonas TaxID=44011 RepID=UPI0003F80ACD|nr:MULTISPECIES: type II toxin-antitoxin system RatA family toxin [Ferrimonas]USD38433.1 type II toxin-antitoxin system RatA family toxin [Ferrimonas sp. SCSIO 43195]